MKKPQEKYIELFNNDCYPARAEELYGEVASELDEVKSEYLNQLLEIVYCCGFTDGYDESKFFYKKILR